MPAPYRPPPTFNQDTALRKALDVFWKRGYEDTSLSDVTQAMGIASASLYAAFGSKEALFRESLALYSTREGSTAQARAARAPLRPRRDRGHAARHRRLDQPAGHAARLHAGHCRAHRRHRKLRGAGIPGRPAARHAHHDQGPARPRRRRRRPHRLSRPSLDAIARYYTTVVEGMSIQARDGASRADLETVITWVVGFRR
jgi:AcrR family transcriptional regulator